MSNRPLGKASLAGAIGLLALLCTACSTLTAYVHPAGQPSARIDLSKTDGTVTLCLSGKQFELKPDKADEAEIPAGRRVALFNYFSYDAYSEVGGCVPGVSFIPVAGGRYLANFEAGDQRCRMEVFRENKALDVGLEPEPSVAPPFCSSGASK